jgi:hypothetical protein
MCQESPFSQDRGDCFLSILICQFCFARVIDPRSHIIIPVMVLIASPMLLQYVCTMVRLVYPIESETTRKTRKPTSTMWSSLKGAEAIFGPASAEAVGSTGRIVAHVGRTGERSR